MSKIQTIPQYKTLLGPLVSPVTSSFW
uniref:Uncharacterized protein n=1 Tax=Arundo donax TaxID=35708 RepID=A0A0A9AHW7_ARUDO